MRSSSRIQVDLGFNFPQWRAWQAIRPRSTVFLGWGRGVGKSWFRRQVWWTLIQQNEHRLRKEALVPFRGLRVTSLAPTLKQWKDIHWAGIESELLKGGPWAHLGARLDKQGGQITFPGGGSVRPFPASAYASRTARGMRTDILDADEVDDIDPAVYDSVAVPWLSEPWSFGLELPGGTPTRGRHGLWWRFLQAGRTGERLRAGEPLEQVLGAEETARFEGILGEDGGEVDELADALKSIHAFHATYRDAPETVSRRAVARALATTPTPTFKREWEADPDAGEGLIYPFDETFHVRQPPPLSAFREFYVGQDHGWVDAGVLLFCGVLGHGNDAELWVIYEHYESEVPNHVWDQRAAVWRQGRFFSDPSRPDRINDLRSLGLDVGETDNNLKGGIARVADLLFRRRREDEDSQYARLYVSPACRNTIREFGLYRRKKNTDGTFSEDPEDRNNHAMDALRYVAVGRFGRGPNTRTIVSGR